MADYSDPWLLPDEPRRADLRYDDQEYNPAAQPKKSAKAWLNLLEEAEGVFEDWHNHCDNIDKLYANLDRLAAARDKQFQLFWANMEVLKPAIYARPPNPVVVPKFRDRRPVYNAASEVLERCCQVNFDLAYINEIMLSARDDLALHGRGVIWCRYDSGRKGSYYDHEKVCYDFKNRRDFLHSISRNWAEVTWVAAASYLTRAQARARFSDYSDDEYQDAEYLVDKDSREVGGADERERAKFWEIWHRPSRRVVWVAKGCENILDEADPHLDIAGFYPCPKPVYGTCQPGSLVPVPDQMQYLDQINEVNLLTARIHALSNALQAKGFYPGGAGETTDQISEVMQMQDPGRVIVPISNWASFGGSKEVIIWIPIDMIAQCITSCVELRKQIIEDVYQIIGLSDIMRGATDPRETLGAQSLKTQYGSTRIRDKQSELVRIARDLVCITADIICDKFKGETIIQMSQTQLPTTEMQEQTVAEMERQMQQQSQALIDHAQSPQTQQMMQQSGPDAAAKLAQQAQMAVQSAQQEINRAASQPTIDQVLKFFKDHRARSFVLDIETDSTIMVDEQQDKAMHTEFLQTFTQTLQQLAQIVVAAPYAVNMCGQMLKFAVKPFRVGRELDMAIDDFVEASEQQAEAAGQREDPTVSTNRTALQIEQLKQQRQAERDKADVALKQQELQLRDQHEKMKIQSQEQIKLLELQAKKGDEQAKAQVQNQKAMHDRETHQADMIEKAADMRANEQQMAMRQADQIARHQDMAARAAERSAAQQFRQQQHTMRPPQGFPQ